MSMHFCISVRFLQPVCHGRGERGQPEWPPSPLRLYQALVAASAGRWNEKTRLEHAADALRWLEHQQPPTILAAVGQRAGAKFRLYVPDNVGDKVAASWSRGGVASFADYRTEKDVCATYLSGDAVHYLYSISDGDAEFERHKEVLIAASRSVTHLGWGIDMVTANAAVVSSDEAENLLGERWQPIEDAFSAQYRVPVDGTLAALVEKHEVFLNRVGPEGFNPVPPLTAFRVVGYRQATDPRQREFVAFSVLQPDASGYRPFDPRRGTRDMAGMIRHAVADSAKRHGWSAAEINVFVHGKTPDGLWPASGQKSPDRFMYLPLPTISHRHGRVESIRRVLVVAPAHCTQQASWARRALAGEELRSDSGEAVALLTILPRTDWVLRKYIGESETWSTVTPVILPRHDGYESAMAGEWIKAAFEQAGFARELVSKISLEWRRVGFRSGVDLASRYLPPENLKHKPRYHVSVRFPHAIAGPIVVGSGRFRGFGLFATND